jgi:exodeoxyribonuclease V alpha subunit
MKIPAGLLKSKFRKSFKLDAQDHAYLSSRGKDVIRSHASDFILKRLAPAVIPNDGKQTPVKGHPVFKAQHATATCCRGCLLKWYRIPKGRQLTSPEINGVVEVIVTWIESQEPGS